MTTRILVPLDGSVVAEQILPAVATFVTAIRNCALELLYVIDPTELGGTSPAELNRSKELAAAYLTTRAHELARPGTSVTTQVTLGPPARVILDRLDQGGFDFAFMATNGRTGLARTVLGSVTDRVIRESSVPVVALHPQTPIIPETGPRVSTADLIAMFARGDAVSARAMRTLIDRGKPAVPDLMAALHSSNVETRLFAARTLGRIHDEQSLALLVEHLADPVWEVRWEVEEALAHFGQAGIESVLRLAQSAPPDGRLNISLLHVLGRTPVTYFEVLKPVTEALRSPVHDVAVPVAAAHALHDLREAQRPLAGSAKT